MEGLPSFHFDLALHPTKDTIKLITSLLEKVISVNDALCSSTNNNDKPTGSSAQLVDHAEQSEHRRRSSSRRLSASNIYTCFHARSIPSISIQAYLTRILKYCPCANECFLAILVYFDRMAKPAPPCRTVPLRIDSYNVHRLIIAGVMIASKLFSDVFFTNTRYAKVGGLPVSELNILEVEFLALNEYNLFISVEEFQYYGDQLLIHWMKERENEGDVMNMGINDPGYIGSNPPQTSSSLERDIDTNTATSPSISRNQADKEHENDAAQINYAARQLSIDKSDTTVGCRDAPKATTPMKDLNRKSDEIDQHRLFKRPSSRIDDSSNNNHLRTSPLVSHNSTNAISPTTTPSGQH